MDDSKLLGLRSVIYPVDDLEESKRWWTKTLGVQPYFDEAFYVGYHVAGFELGLFPNGNKSDGPITYWGVPDVETAFHYFKESGATVVSGVDDVGAGIRVAVFRSPQQEIFGLIYNPHFKIT